MKSCIENTKLPLEPEEYDINPSYLQRLDFNPNYYCPDDGDLNIGDEIVVGTYVSTKNGTPTIKWSETRIIGLPLNLFYQPYVTCRKLIKNNCNEI